MFELPTRFDFGVVPLDTAAMGSVEVENTGTESCILNLARVATFSDPGFSLVAPLESITFASGSTYAIEVQFQTAFPGTYFGTLDVFLSSPDSAFNTVSLTARTP
ncbi:MAG: hypothetical protein AAGD10_16650 [Myxococcota bacterium]